MKKFKKFLLISLIVMLVAFGATIITGTAYYFAVTNAANIDVEKLESSTSTSLLKVVSNNGKAICPSSETYIPITKLSENTKNAFISAEDKRFYEHSGIDYIRIGGAVVSNLKSHSFSEGASTISQQLIKNTHLSNEKTINRKLKEIKLTKQLEKKYSKDKILEMYLNNIYFGNGCYGIENASNHYFSKSASELTLAESALLAGTINAPSVYDIQNNTDKAIKRRNLILNLMHNYGKISEKDLESAKNENVNLKLTKLKNNNFIYNEIIEEACKILKINETQLNDKNITIVSHIDMDLQNQINDTIQDKFSNLESSPEVASIVVDNKTNGIVAINGNKKTLSLKKQPGSAIKPILVYAPAIENGMISPATKILDEKIDIGGYRPENADKRFHGFVSARDALSGSLNIPAVKLLNELGIQNAQAFAKKLGIDFLPSDNNLAIALGGFTEGTELKTLCDSYTAFANLGSFAPSKYISKIILKGKTIYTHNVEKNNVMKDSTAYLITNMLLDSSKKGTAKRLKNFDYQIASKTGTVGQANGSKNLKAYNISYTSNHTILSFVGDSVMPENINGATYPTMLTKEILTKLYSDYKPQNFKIPSSVIACKINKTDYQNNIISATSLDEDYIIEYFDKNNLPALTDNSLDLNLEVSNFNNSKPIISFFAPLNYNYKIVRNNNSTEEIIFNESNNNSSQNIKFEDKSANTNEIYEYYVVFCEKSSNKTYETERIKLKAY